MGNAARALSSCYHRIERNEIRLVKFLRDGDDILSRFEVFSMDKTIPQYHTLSYVWSAYDGPPSKTWTLDFDGVRIPVLDSLRPFIQTLRVKKRLLDGTWWWIDSICIDQANVDERNYQIQLMGDIYRRAHQVIVWLGDESKDSSRAIDFIKFLHKRRDEWESDEIMRSEIETGHHQQDWAALSNFFHRKWWTRIWTVQEFVLPDKVVFWCGQCPVSRTSVCASLGVADKCSSTGFKGTSAFVNGWNRRRLYLIYITKKDRGLKFRLSLPALAAYCSSNNATDDKDRLYALGGFTGDFSLLNVSYDWSVEDVYLQFAQSFITHYNSLDMMCFRQLYTNSKGSWLPSWVPDWRTQPLPPHVVPLMVSQSSNDQIGNLRPIATLEFEPEISYKAFGNRPPSFSFDGTALQVLGMHIDTVDGIAGSRGSDMVQSSKFNHSSKGGDLNSTLALDILKSICKSMVWDRKDRYLRYPMPTDEFLHEFLCICYKALSKACSFDDPAFLDWFDQTKALQIRGLNLESILHLHGQEDQFSDLTPNLNEYIPDSFFGRFTDTVVKLSNRVMVSENGFVGMVPKAARKSDVICVLFGCSVPVLLRRTKNDNKFIFIGECFIDGYMYGEALKNPDFSEDTLYIV